MTLAFDAVTVVRGGRSILAGVSAVAPRGMFTVVIGKNGAGKSTLLRAAAGIAKPDQGTISIGDEALYDLSSSARAAKVAYVPDETDVAFDFRVLDVVLLGRHALHHGQPRAADRDAAALALAAVDASALAERRIKSLSRGERQRVMLARALAAETPVVILDEPTANLDVAAALRLLALFKRLSSQGKTILASIHDLGLAERAADAAICLTDGTVTAAGSAASVFADDVLTRAFDVTATRAGGVLRFDLPDQ
jgi:iron complex transport system ATP-binding protein